MNPAADIFKAYDIRGVVDDTLTEDTVRAIGQALGELALQAGQSAVAVGRDGRLSGPRLQAALTEGITSTGVDVWDVGQVPTPLVYFAAHHYQLHACVAVTGSHNPPAYNGLKMVIGGHTLYGDAIQNLRTRIVAGGFTQGQGHVKQVSVIPEYMARVISGVQLSRPMRVVLDAGNGVAGAVAPELFKALGCEVTPLFCEVDGHFPNHHPDPSKPDNLRDLIAALADGQGEIGLAFDGDGDRLGVVTSGGEIIYPDRQLMLFAADVLSRNRGATIIYDVKCTRILPQFIRACGGEPLMWKTGHALIKAKLKETGAALAGEMSGHMFFSEGWYGFDDGIYAGARLLGILSRYPNALQPLQSLPSSASTPEINIAMPEGEPVRLVADLLADAQAFFPDAEAIIGLDGVRVEFADGFGLARPSNTTPVLVLRFEGDHQAALECIMSIFRAAISQLRPELTLTF